MQQDTVQIDVPKSALVAAFLAQMARASAPADIPLTNMEARAALLPSIGAPLENGLYAGLTVHRNLPMALVLLPGESKLPWEKAKAWATEQGGMLPSRVDALLLWQNLPGEFEKEWHWTSEEFAGNAAYAWIQSFNYGHQSSNLKSNDYRCRAVRRVAI